MLFFSDVMSILIRLMFFLAVSILLLRAKRLKGIDSFHEQTWLGKDILPIYFVFTLTPLIVFIFRRTSPPGVSYLSLWYAFTLFMTIMLFVLGRTIIIKDRNLSVKVIGLRSSDIYVFILFNLVLYFILFILISDTKNPEAISHVILPMLNAVMIVTIWPALEGLFYLGMMFIPTCRIAGLKLGAILVALSSVLAHYHYGLANIFINLLIVLFYCYLYFKTKRILFPVLLHSLVNFFILLRDLS